jgi:hypothetical protein
MKSPSPVRYVTAVHKWPLYDFIEVRAAFWFGLIVGAAGMAVLLVTYKAL